jgi:ketosteroid isomerase-like protein
VDLLRRYTDALNSRDLAAFLSCCDPDIEIASGGVLIGTPTYRGHSGIEELFRDIAVTWEELRSESHKVVAVGDALVIVGEAVGEGKTAGIPFAAQPMAAHFAPTGRWRVASSSLVNAKPSKPPGCGSRRCPRRTWR